MVYRGTFRNGVVVFDGNVNIPEGRTVQVHLDLEDREKEESTVTQELLKLSGTIRSGRKDGSRNHDHYIYGIPKREPEE